jgi:hypothetical protein
MENNNTNDLVGIYISMKSGQSPVIEERRLRNSVLTHDVFYQGEIQKGKKWLSASVSKSRLNKIEFSMMQGKLEGDVWCLAEDYETQKSLLIQKAEQMIKNIIEEWQKTISLLHS